MLVSLVQMRSGRDLEANIIEARKWVDQAIELGSRLVVLPEMFVCLGVKEQADISVRVVSAKGVLETLSHWAREGNIYLLAGSMPFPCELGNNKVYASSVLFGPDGGQISRYDKIHLFDVDVNDEKGSYRESDTFYPGEKPCVAKVDGELMGMSICYDLRFPELYQEYMAKGCSIISVPSAFTFETGRQHWEILLRARAIETQSFILAANQGGVHDDGRETWGHSMIVAPSGEVLAQLTGQESGVATADLDFSMRDKLTSAMPILKHKRLNN